MGVSAYGQYRPNSKRAPEIYCIEGEHVTLEIMRERCGLGSVRSMSAKYAYVRRLYPVVTWALLGAKANG